jgi:thiol:disulfide interchange protein
MRSPFPGGGALSGRRSLSPTWTLALLTAAALVGMFAGRTPGRAPRNGLQHATPLADSGRPARAGRVEATEDSLALAAISPGGMGENPASDASRPIDPSPLYSEWTTYDDAVRQARESGKPVLLDFNAGWSEPCLAQAHEVFDTLAAGYTVRAAVIPVSITDRVREDDRNPAGVAELERRYKVVEFPTLVVFSPVTGRSRRVEGYKSAAESLGWITEAAEAVR